MWALEGTECRPLRPQSRVSARAREGSLGVSLVWSEKTVCALETGQGCAWPRKEAFPGCGQKMAQFPQRCQLGLCRYIRKACYPQQLPLQTTKGGGTPCRPNVPTSSLCSLTASLPSDPLTCKRLP